MAEIGQYRIQSFAFILSVCAAFTFSCIFISNHDEFGSTVNQEQIRLDNRINPNNATIASLTRLPGIGTAKAEAIIVYRRDLGQKNGDNKPFQDLDDLQKVKGIGPKTVQSISEWLKFD